MSATGGGSAVAERNLDRITIFMGVAWFACIVILSLLLKAKNG
jgi:preprotein translocase subunit SecG